MHVRSDITQSAAAILARSPLTADKGCLADVLDKALLHFKEPARHNFKAMYEWFAAGDMAHPGPRLHGKRLPGVDSDFSHCALRGIHVPKEDWFENSTRYAASVTACVASLYDESGEGEPLLELEDGTWVLLYSAHVNNKGNETSPLWNSGLMNCMRDSVPVGVFWQDSTSARQYYRALAWVENFDSVTQTFIIHGPINNETLLAMQQDIDFELMDFDDGGPSVEELEEDNRERESAKRAARKGQQKFRESLLAAYKGTCALSTCEVPAVLQAAHIIPYSGTQSNCVRNGILLREDLHTLFDSYLLGINPQSLRVELSSAIANSQYAEYAGTRLVIPDDPSLQPRRDYLSAKYRSFSIASARACA